jgi:hypothetical protein
MVTIRGISDHKDVQDAYKHHINGNFTKQQKTIFAFWANDIERDQEGKFIEHHGKATALNFQKQSVNNGTTPVVLMEDFEGEKNVLVLNDYEKRTDISPFILSAVCASASYAKSVQDTILTSVKGAAINSFFRTNELPVIMNNPNIKTIINVSRDDPQGKFYSKKEAYHVLRDEWLETTIKEFKEAAEKFKDNKIHEETYQTAVDKMAAEVVLSNKALNKTPLLLNAQAEYQNYNASDIVEEMKRAKECQELIRQYPILEQRVKNKLLIDNKTINAQVHNYLDNKTSRDNNNVTPNLVQNPRLKRPLQYSR